MRVLAVGVVAILSACATHGDGAEQLCEVEISIVHSPHHIQSTQRVEGNTSYFMCTLYTNGPTPSDASRQELLESRCRQFIREAMSAAAACNGVRFDPQYRGVDLSPIEGTDANGPFFALAGTAQRVAP